MGYVPLQTSIEKKQAEESAEVYDFELTGEEKEMPDT